MSLDLFGGQAKKELSDAKREIFALREKILTLEKERDFFKGKVTQELDKSAGLLSRIKQLVGCLESEEVILQMAWDILESSLAIKKGAIYARTAEGWNPVLHKGFAPAPPPVLPANEESIAIFAVQHGVALTIAHVKGDPELAHLERGGAVKDIKIAVPVRIKGLWERIIVVCQYGGNVFASEDDVEMIQMVASLMGMVTTNSLILAEQKNALDARTQELSKVRGIFTRMVSPEVIKFIEQNPGGIVLGGSKQRVAVFFADIRGFTSFSERFPPEIVVEMLNEYFTNLTRIVMTHRGTLDKFIGDAAMVLFGTPMAIDNPCLRAVEASFDIQRMVASSMPDWVSRGFPEFGIGIGINFQDVVVGNVGSETFSNFTAIGDGVNLASRLCSKAGKGEIIVSQPCFEQIRDVWKGRVEERQGVVVKGKSDALTVFALFPPDETGAAGVAGPEALPGPSDGATSQAGSVGIPAGVPLAPLPAAAAGGGALEAISCPQCQTPIAAGVRFCGNCGYRRG